MSQRLCVGFNCPPLAIRAEDPISISPEAVNRAGPSCVVHAAAASALNAPFAWFGPPFEPSVARGVFQLESATVFLLLSLFPASLLPFCAGVPAIGVGQEANCACLGNWSVRERSDPSGLTAVSAMPSESFQSLVVVVTQDARFATPFSVTCVFDPSGFRPVAEASPMLCPPSPFAFAGVGHAAAAVCKFRPPSRPWAPAPVPELAVVVGQVARGPVDAEATVRGTDAR